MQIPWEMVEEELEAHLIEAHQAKPETILKLKLSLDEPGWVRFLVRSHNLLHTISEYAPEPEPEDEESDGQDRVD